jgi:flagellar hook assembly protein FlgD
VHLRVFTLSGKLIKTLHQVVYTSGYKVDNIVWDGTGDDGTKIGMGMYVYYISVSLPDGSTVQKSSKLVFVR